MTDETKLLSRELDLRAVIRDELKHGDEAYSVDIWLAWMKRGGPKKKRYAMPIVHRALKAMEETGEITSRIVVPADHGASQWVRRYYCLAQKAGK